MNDIPKKTNKSRMYVILSLACVLSAALLVLTPVAAAKEYIPPGYEYTVNYYKAYGEPDISASVLGDTEFERGETAQMRVILSNKGVLYGFKADTLINTSEKDHKLSLKELEYEALKTAAYGIKASLASPTDLIEIEASTNSQMLDELLAGDLSEDPFIFTVTISDNAPAGVYLLEMPLTYEYQNDVRMTSGESVRLGLPALDHATFYKAVEHTIQIPITVKAGANFEVTDISGNLTAGSEDTINVTYTNTGELPAYDSIARLIIMKPLSSEHSTKSLGIIQPGESKTASFVVSSDFLAVEKSYGIDSEIKYKDADGDDDFSGNMKVHVNLKKPEGKINVTYLALFGLVVMGIVLIIKNMKKNGSNGSDD
ncbi:hypothetical protein V7O66_06980 [Methanolobus sp. ZRKC3]|uniref:COG1361 S-layer family protein n=1 Tax=Methanolobus sp. ZRKC3 TaxID=3125786 RepID=UPI003254562B